MNNRHVQATWRYHDCTKHSSWSIRNNRQFLDRANLCAQHLGATGLTFFDDEVIELFRPTRKARAPSSYSRLAAETQVYKVVSRGVAKRHRSPETLA
jgi:hypothetical protein